MSQRGSVSEASGWLLLGTLCLLRVILARHPEVTCSEKDSHQQETAEQPPSHLDVSHSTRPTVSGGVHSWGSAFRAAVLGSDLLSQELDLLIYEEGEGKRPKATLVSTFNCYCKRPIWEKQKKVSGSS